MAECGTCKYFDKSEKTLYLKNRAFDGRCVRYAPQGPMGENDRAFPYVDEDDSCGDYAEKTT